MNVTQTVLTWVGWPNGKERASACVKFDFVKSECKSSQVNARTRKNTQGLGKRTFKWTQGFNFRLLASALEHRLQLL